MMKCQNVVAALSAFQDGELGPARAQEVGFHLQGCPACRAAWQDLQELGSRLRQLPPPAADPFFPTRVMAGLRPLPARRRLLLQAAAYAFLFAAIFLAGFIIQTRDAIPAAADAAAPPTYSAVLQEPQRLGLMAVQEDSLGLFNGGDNGQK